MLFDKRYFEKYKEEKEGQNGTHGQNKVLQKFFNQNENFFL